MSKITIPLLMIFAAIGLIALAKLDHGSKERRQVWPAKGTPPPPEPTGEIPVPKPTPPELPESLSTEEFERLTTRELHNIRLLPKAEEADAISFLWPTDGNDAPAHPELLAFAKRSSFDGWKSFTDADIGFFYPDAPGVAVQALEPGDPVPLLAGTMLPQEGGNLIRRYRISAGATGSLCVISLYEDGGFDDGPREPFPETFHRFTPGAAGDLLRCAFTEQGQVRRIELLGNGLRAALLDWPHLAVHQDIYLRIGSSMELAGPHGNIRELSQAAAAEYGLEGRLGFLDHGISESEIIATLGQPAARDEQHHYLDYLRGEDGNNIFYRLHLKNGMFAGFESDWREVVRTAPEDGTVRWMFEKSDYRAGKPGGIGYNLGALTDADAQLIFDRFVELAPDAGESDWSLLCGSIANLAQHGLKDPRVPEVVRARLADLPPGEDARPALLALESCDDDFSKAAIAEHMIASFASSSLPPETLEHFYTLIAYIGKDHPAGAQLIDRAMSHGASSVRALGFLYYDWLPEKFALPHLEAGLSDPSVEIRRSCAEAFSSKYGDSARHPEFLAAVLAQEGDEKVRELLQSALERLAPQAQ